MNLLRKGCYFTNFTPCSSALPAAGCFCYLASVRASDGPNSLLFYPSEPRTGPTRSSSTRQSLGWAQLAPVLSVRSSDGPNWLQFYSSEIRMGPTRSDSTRQRLGRAQLAPVLSVRDSDGPNSLRFYPSEPRTELFITSIAANSRYAELLHGTRGCR